VVGDDSDLGVITERTLKPVNSAEAAGAANAVTGMIKRTHLCKNKELIQLYKTLV